MKLTLPPVDVTVIGVETPKVLMFKVPSYVNEEGNDDDVPRLKLLMLRIAWFAKFLIPVRSTGKYPALKLSVLACQLVGTKLSSVPAVKATLMVPAMTGDVPEMDPVVVPAAVRFSVVRAPPVTGALNTMLRAAAKESVPLGKVVGFAAVTVISPNWPVLFGEPIVVTLTDPFDVILLIIVAHDRFEARGGGGLPTGVIPVGGGDT